MNDGNGKWRNRIVGSGELPASEFLANPDNWRIHPRPQQEALEGALNEIGWIQEVVVNQQSGNMIDGHLRVTLALRHGDDTPVPVKYVDLSPAEEALALTTLDPIAAMAAADRDKLSELMQDIQTGEAGLQAMLAGLAEENGLTLADASLVNGKDIEGDQLVEAEKEIRPRSMLRVLVSIPLNEAILAKEIIEGLSNIRGVEITYGAN